MYSCYIVDDNARAINVLSRLIEETPDLCLAGAFTNPLDALPLIIKERPDITFLDIQMPQLNGLDLARMAGSCTSVIFTTAYPEYAVDAFEENARDYLLKPFTSERFQKALNKIRSGTPISTGSESDHLYLKGDAKGEYLKVKFNDILYVQAFDDYVKFFTGTDKFHLTNSRLKTIEEELPASRFIRIHKSHIVNTEKIKGVRQGQVYLENGVRLDIGPNYRESFLRSVEEKTISKRKL